MRKKRDKGKERRTWWPAPAIVAAACAFCWPVFAGRIMLPADMCLLMLPWKELQEQFGFHRPHNPMFDPIQQYLPWRIYAVESVRSGFVPLWNPYAFCGTPFLANLQSTLLYPLNLLFLTTGAKHGFGVSAILHLALGGLFMYALLRTLELRPAAALLGALVLMFNGFTVAWLEFPTLSLWVFMWLPAMLLCYERAVRAPRSLWPVLCALVVGVQFLGGHLQISAYVVIAFILYVVVRVISRRDRTAGRPLAIAIALGSLAVGLALAAGQILPTLELARQTGRVGHAAGAAVKTAFPLGHLILYLVPNFLGNPVDYNYWGDFRDPGVLNFFETACYVGVLPLFLAAVGLRRAFLGAQASRLQQQPAWFFGGVAAFGFLVAIGSPVYLVLYYLAPGFRELAGLGRTLCLTAFGLAGLAAVGSDHLLAQDKKERVRLPVICAVVGVGAVAAAMAGYTQYLRAVPASGFETYLARQVIVAVALMVAAAAVISLRMRLRIQGGVFAFLAIVLVVADLFTIGINFNPFTDPSMAYPEMDSIRWLRQHAGHERVTSLASDKLDWMAHNSAMVFGLRDIHGSDSLRVRRSFELVSGPELAQSLYPPPDSPLMDALGVRYLMTRREVGEGWELGYGGESPIYENKQALPRAFVVSDFRAGKDEEFVDLLAGGSEELRRVALVAPSGPPLPIPQTGAPPPDAAVSFVRDAPDEIVVETDTKQGGLLVVMDSYCPGWKAWLYETEVPIARADYGFRGVALPPGKQVVRFRYEPGTYGVGLFVSLVSLAILAGVSMSIYLGLPERTAKRARRS